KLHVTGRSQRKGRVEVYCTRVPPAARELLTGVRQGTGAGVLGEYDGWLVVEPAAGRVLRSIRLHTPVVPRWVLPGTSNSSSGGSGETAGGFVRRVLRRLRGERGVVLSIWPGADEKLHVVDPADPKDVREGGPSDELVTADRRGSRDPFAAGTDFDVRR